jgi:hypothetical protein
MGIGTIEMSTKCIEFIKSILPEGSTILELGSGKGTIELSNYYTMISIENQPEWQDKFPLCTTYINVGNKEYNETDFRLPNELKDMPRQVGWYNPDELIPKLPAKSEYDLLLIDGPGGWLGRAGFLMYLDNFNTDIPIILDDVHRPQERMIIEKLSEKLNKEYKILNNTIGYIL